MILSNTQGKITHWQLGSPNLFMSSYLSKTQLEITCSCLCAQYIYATGNRTGYIQLYDLQQKGTLMPAYNSTPAHKPTIVTSLKCYGSNLYSIGKDCCLCIFELKNIEIALINKIRIAEFTNIRDLIMFNDDIYILGFHGAKCHLWSVYDSYELWSIQCKGSNHPMQLISNNDCIFLLMGIKEKLYYHSSRIANQIALGPEGHGQEILSCCEFNGIKGCFITTSEDRQAKIWSAKDSKVCYSMKCHIGSVRNVLQITIKGNNYLLSLGSKSQIVTNQIIINNGKIGMCLIEIHYAYKDEENRINTAVSVERANPSIMIGSSSGIVSLLELDGNIKLKLLESLDLNNVVNILRKYEKSMYLCAQTHGYIAMLNTDIKLSLLAKQALHTASINGVEVYKSYIITSSDDESIIMSTYSSGKFTVIKRVENAHYSSIRCSLIYNSWLLTTGYDQVLNVWSIDTFSIVHSCKHPIADCSSMCVVDGKHIVIAGMGYAIMDII